MAYQDVAKNIIKESIKTAVYIDENALEAYEKMPETPSAEQALSVELTKKLRESNIDLTVFKYEAQKYKDQKNYVFANKDLVLLDWELDGEGGGGLSALNVLHELIEMRSVHFCTIYTNTEELCEIVKEICSYFCGVDQTMAAKFMEELTLCGDYDHDIFKSALWEYAFTKDSGRKRGIADRLRGRHPQAFDVVKSNFLISAAVINGKYIPESNPYKYSDYDLDNQIVVVENMLIFVRNKKVTKAENLINEIYSRLSITDMGFWPLLGLEVRNKIRTSDAFIDREIFGVPSKALAYQRDRKGNDFSSYLTEVIVKHLSMHIESTHLKLPNELIWNPKEDNPHDYDQYFAQMNIFYNACTVINKGSLMFGDVFKMDDTYYMCISPLCDCAHGGENFYFYFAEGKGLAVKKALSLKENGYISYLPNAKCVNWKPDDKNGKPIPYIVPRPIFIPNSNNIVDGKLRVKLYENNSFVDKSFEYITTIKQNYAQRIANFAFTHSTRVGINFAFIDEENNNQGADAPGV